jgi:hypothetical protein
MVNAIMLGVVTLKAQFLAKELANAQKITLAYLASALVTKKKAF